MDPDDMPDNSARIRATLEAAGLRYENGCAVSPNGGFDPVPVEALDPENVLQGLTAMIWAAGFKVGFEQGERATRSKVRAALGL